MTEIQQPDLNIVLKRVIQTSNADSLLAKGLHEVCKAIEHKEDRFKAKYVIVAKNCDQASYVKLVKGLAAQNKIPIYEVDQAEILGEWLGICKYDKKKNVTKKRKCSSVAIRDFSAQLKVQERKMFLEQLNC